MKVRISAAKSSLAIVCATAVMALAQPASAADKEFALTIKDHHFSPVPLTIPADTKVKITLTNQDSTTAEFMSDEFKGGKVVAGGKTVSFFIGPLKAGTYEFHDEYAEEASKTQLIVQ